jgi:hypothetical protein
MAKTVHACGRSALLFALLCSAWARAGEAPTLHYSGGLGLGYDSNPANAESGNTVPATGYASGNLAASLSQRPGENTALLLRGSLDSQSYFNYVGLSNVKASLLLRGVYRPDGGFLTPSFAAWGSAALWQFEKSERDSGEYKGGVYAGEQLSTAISLRLGGYYADRRSASNVFDLHSKAATLDADWLLGERLTAYLGFEMRYGSFATSSPKDAGAAAHASVKEPDDAIIRDGQYDMDYRLDGHTRIGTLGLNYALTPKLALDLQGMQIHTRADDDDHYLRWLATASLLARF